MKKSEYKYLQRTMRKIDSLIDAIEQAERMINRGTLRSVAKLPIIELKSRVKTLLETIVRTSFALHPDNHYTLMKVFSDSLWYRTRCNNDHKYWQGGDLTCQTDRYYDGNWFCEKTKQTETSYERAVSFKKRGETVSGFLIRYDGIPF